MDLIEQPQRWGLVTDQVMGGESTGSMNMVDHDNRRCIRLAANVSTANGGGFVQVSCDLRGIDIIDAGRVGALALVAAGTPESFNIHLRTCDLQRPWQSYRWQFDVGSEWQEWLVPLDAFVPHRTDQPFDATRLTRVGIVALGRDFSPELFIHSLRLIKHGHF